MQVSCLATWQLAYIQKIRLRLLEVSQSVPTWTFLQSFWTKSRWMSIHEFILSEEKNDASLRTIISSSSWKIRSITNPSCIIMDYFKKLWMLGHLRHLDECQFMSSSFLKKRMVPQLVINQAKSFHWEQ